MNKMKIKEYLDNYYVQLGSFFLLALILIFVSIVLFEDINLDNMILVQNIYGTLALTGFLYSYDLSKRRLRNDLEIGLTRKEVYRLYLFQVFISLVFASFIVLYYAWIHQHVIKESFVVKEIAFLAVVYLALSFFGFFLGIFKIRKLFFHILSAVITIIIVLMIIYIGMKYYLYLDIAIAVIAIVLGILNYLLIMKRKI